MVILLQACVGSSPVPPDRYYRLQDPANVAKLSQPLISKTLGIKRLRADGLHSGRAIVYVDRKSPLELLRYHYHHWVESPSHLIQDNMVAYFRAIGLAKKIVRYDSVKQADMLISGELLRFERILTDDGPQVLVTMELHYGQGSGHSSRWDNTYSARIKANGPKLYATIEAFSKALEMIYIEFTKDLQTRI